MEYDFSAILLTLTVLFGAVWAFDRLFMYKKRKARFAAEDKSYRDPIVVEWARSLFPVVLVVLALRSFVVEPFRIPSGSMMPTLDVGDFILVNKFAYGLRLPVFHTKFLSTGDPERGDVVVFRWPGFTCHRPDGKVEHGGDPACTTPVPRQDWIKRIIGLPGDTIEVHDSQISINGKPVTATKIGPFKGNPARAADNLLMSFDATIWNEHLGKVSHLVARMPSRGLTPPIPNDRVPSLVPEGCYLVMGDDRENSEDSRYWGCMPETALVGKAFLIWMSWRGWGTGGIDFHRIGKSIR